MTRSQATPLALIALFITAVPYTVQASDPTQDPSIQNTTATPAAKPHKRRTPRKKRPANNTPLTPAEVNATLDSDIANTPTGKPDGMGSNNPGGPNRGSGDHIPGTTGTSGQ